MQVILDHVEKLSEHIVSYHFRSELPVRYVAGQFIELTIPHDNADDRGIKRWFTLSSSPTHKLLTITTKHSTPSSSYKHALHALKPGSTVEMSDPLGDFVLPKDPNQSLLFVAGGIGVTPFHSMIQWLQDKNEVRDIQLVHAVSDMKELVFADLFESSDIDYITLSGKPLVAEDIIEMTGGLQDKMLYLAGPEAMIEALNKKFVSLGITQASIVTDYFPGYSAN